MFSLLQNKTTKPLGNLLKGDVSIDFLDRPISSFQSSQMVFNTVPHYAIEKDLAFLLAKKEVITFGAHYVLISAEQDTPLEQFEHAIFQLQLKGYVPVLVHAEQYMLLQNSYKHVERLLNRGGLLSVDLLSLSGYRGKAAKTLAERLFKEEEVSFVDTSIQTQEEEKLLRKLLSSKTITKYLQSKMIRNRELSV